MKAHKLKPVIKAQIRAFFGMLRPGDTIRSEDLTKYVKRQAGIRYIYPDSILRYLRELRQDDELNYTCIHKQDRIFKILEVGEPHSL